MAPASPAASAPRPPRAGALGCLERCADLRAAAVGGRIAITGSHLGAVSRVEFRGRSGSVSASPAVVHAHRVEVVVPRHARSGRPQGHRREGAGGSDREVASARAGAPAAPTRRLRPARRSGAAPPRVRRRTTPGDARVSLPRPGLGGRPGEARAQGQHQADLEPAGQASLQDAPPALGRNRPGQGAAPPGHYRFKVQRPGHRGHPSARFRLYDGEFPVRGPPRLRGRGPEIRRPPSGGGGSIRDRTCSPPVAPGWSRRVEATCRREGRIPCCTGTGS